MLYRDWFLLKFEVINNESNVPPEFDMPCVNPIIERKKTLNLLFNGKSIFFWLVAINEKIITDETRYLKLM